MQQSTRKLWGTLGFIVLVIVYPLAVMALLGSWLASQPWWATIPIVAVAGLIWFYPAAALIRWMARPK